MKARIKSWQTDNIPRSRRVRFTRRSHLDALLQQAEGRLTPVEIDVLDFRLGVSDGHAHTLKETCERFEMTLAQIKGVETKFFGEKIAKLSNQRLREIIRKGFEDPEWAKKVLAECQEEC